ncbi:MAG: AAA family ATPase [bacterium]
MSELILHPTTASQLDTAALQPTHGYLFTGATGLGKTSSALNLAKTLLGNQASAGDFGRWILFIEPEEGKKLRLEQLERVHDFANHSKPSSINSKVIILDGADLLTIEAANSLLLLLEEPPPFTTIILVAERKEMIPKTVISRLQLINFYPPTSSQIEALISEYKVSPETYSVIGRYPARLISASLEDSVTHEQLLAKAQSFLEGGISDRLVVSSGIADKSEARVLISTISRNMQKQSFSRHWFVRANSLIKAQIHLYNNGNPKFVLEHLALEFE